MGPSQEVVPRPAAGAGAGAGAEGGHGGSRSAKAMVDVIPESSPLKKPGDGGRSLRQVSRRQPQASFRQAMSQTQLKHMGCDMLRCEEVLILPCSAD